VPEATIPLLPPREGVWGSGAKDFREEKLSLRLEKTQTETEFTTIKQY
jgi:hypothetical protein